MIRFNNDYNHGAHPEILEALGAINGNSYGAVSYTHLPLVKVLKESWIRFSKILMILLLILNL